MFRTQDELLCEPEWTGDKQKADSTQKRKMVFLKVSEMNETVA
jgi:hypothetical protein